MAEAVEANSFGQSYKGPKFGGSKEKFAIFWTQMLVHAGQGGFGRAIQPEAEDGLPNDEDAELDPDTEDGFAQKACLTRNTKAVWMFTMAFQTDALINIVTDSQTDSFPSGLAWTIIKKLLKLYRPTDLTAQVEMKNDLSRLTLKLSQSPEELSNQIASIKARYNVGRYRIPQIDLITAVLAAAPKEYVSVIQASTKAQGDDLSYDDLIE